MHKTPFARRFFSAYTTFLTSALLLGALATQARSQAVTNQEPPAQKTMPTVEAPPPRPDIGIGRKNLECSGYFRLPPLTGLPQIVGGEQEQERHIYATGDIVYIDAGSQQGVREGQEFHAIRPRGPVGRVHRDKKGDLGVFVQELGQLRVFRVKDNVSVAQVTFACDPLLLGDLLTGVPDRPAPVPQSEIAIDRFTDPNGKPTGRVMMAPDGREMLARGDLIYIDIGAEDKAILGDYVTIYRKVGKGNLFTVKNDELARREDGGFGSERFRGGTFSIMASRSKDSKYRAGEGQFRYHPIKSTEIKKHRPRMPRKVVGEAIIINVQTRTATALITNSAQEIHTGDFVEIK